MEQDCTLLNHIRKETQMGVVGICAVLSKAANSALHTALQEQLQEYRIIHNSADSLLAQKNGKPVNLNPLAKICARLASSMRIPSQDATSKIAQMMIEGNTKGMVKSIRDQHKAQNISRPVSELSEKLLQTELHNIEQMKPFL